MTVVDEFFDLIKIYGKESQDFNLESQDKNFFLRCILLYTERQIADSVRDFSLFLLFFLIRV